MNIGNRKRPILEHGFNFSCPVPIFKRTQQNRPPKIHGTVVCTGHSENFNGDRNIKAQTVYLVSPSEISAN